MFLAEVIDPKLKWRKHPTRKGVLVRHGVGPDIEAAVKRLRQDEQNTKRREKAAVKRDDDREWQKYQNAHEYNIDYPKLARVIEDAVSNAVPDGDPIDSIGNYLKKVGVQYDYSKYLDTAVRLSPMLKHHKTYNGYLKDMWDYYIEQDPTWNDGQNPWS